ncbi:MAG: exodeoxyribonuclease VII small subunit [Candidatus Nanopelagicales bacterium]
MTATPADALPGGPEPEALSYEQARDALAAVVQRLESGAGTLEESLALWERGEALASVCQRWLDGARARIDAARATATAAERPPAGTADPEDEAPF